VNPPSRRVGGLSAKNKVEETRSAIGFAPNSVNKKSDEAEQPVRLTVVDTVAAGKFPILSELP